MAAPAPASCPKCGAPRGASPRRACPRCGLAADRMEAYARTRDAAVPPEVAAAWERVIEAWDDTERHDALLRLAAQHDAYAWTAARYREAKRAAPAAPAPFRSYPDHAVDPTGLRPAPRAEPAGAPPRDSLTRIDAIADRQLDRMRRAAEATLYASATAREERGRAPYLATRVVLALLILAIASGLVFAVLVRGARPGGPGPVPAEAQPAKPAQPAPRQVR